MQRVIRKASPNTWTILINGEQIGGLIRQETRPRLNDRPGGETVFQAEHADGFRPIAASDLKHAARMLVAAWNRSN